MQENTSGQALKLVVGAGISSEKLDALTRALARDLSKTHGLTARLVETPAGKGERGVGSKIGEVVLDFLDGVGIKAMGEIAASLTDILKAYLIREKSITIKLTAGDGTTVNISAKNFSSGAIESVIKAARKLE